MNSPSFRMSGVGDNTEVSRKDFQVELMVEARPAVAVRRQSGGGRPRGISDRGRFAVRLTVRITLQNLFIQPVRSLILVDILMVDLAILCR
jgi:hypothetical protein